MVREERLGHLQAIGEPAYTALAIPERIEDPEAVAVGQSLEPGDCCRCFG
jgi:hypothetical protein